MTTKEQITAWFNAGKAKGNSHMLVVCDTFYHEDYPIYCKTKADAQGELDNPGRMQRVMEIYSYNVNLQQQLERQRVWNL